MQQRNPDAVFAGGAWVFPGGRLDDNDSDPVWQYLVTGMDEARAHQILGLDNCTSPYNLDQIELHEAEHPGHVKALAYWVAALREAFEEAGLLLTKQSVSQQQRDLWREQLLSEKLSWQEIISSNDLILETGQLHYLSRWVTPPNNTRRYDTRFFIAKAPPDQEPSHEDFEAIETHWIKPETALEAGQTGSMRLILPTVVTLRAMCQDFADADELIDHVLAHFTASS